MKHSPMLCWPRQGHLWPTSERAPALRAKIKMFSTVKQSPLFTCKFFSVKPSSPPWGRLHEASHLAGTGDSSSHCGVTVWSATWSGCHAQNHNCRSSDMNKSLSLAATPAGRRTPTLSQESLQGGLPHPPGHKGDLAWSLLLPMSPLSCECTLLLAKPREWGRKQGSAPDRKQGESYNGASSSVLKQEPRGKLKM